MEGGVKHFPEVQRRAKDFMQPPRCGRDGKACVEKIGNQLPLANKGLFLTGKVPRFCDGFSDIFLNVFLSHLSQTFSFFELLITFD